MKLPCPKCERPGVALKDKYRMGYMRDARCGHCNAHLIANLWFLVPFSMVYMWVLAICAFLYMFQDVGAMAIVYAVIAWLVVDLLSMMLIPMKVIGCNEPKQPQPSAEQRSSKPQA